MSKQIASNGATTRDEKCSYCEREQVVPVLDKTTEKRSKPGNKYRRFCVSCRRWLMMCSASFFRNHPSPHVLPDDSELAEKNVIPLAEFDEMSSPNTEKTARHTQTASQKTPQETTGSRLSLSDPVKSKESDFEEKVSILNSSVREMVDCNLLKEGEAYRFLSGKLSELADDTR